MNTNPPEKHIQDTINRLTPLVWLSVLLVFVFLAAIIVLYAGGIPQQVISLPTLPDKYEGYWQAPDSLSKPNTKEGDLIRYGEELIWHTSVYLGPRGKVKPISNGMNCRNCHLQGGRKVFGINYGAVASTYPRWRNRSQSMVNIEERINECLERSLNGTRLNPEDMELKAIAAYLKWIGKDVPEKVIPNGTGLKKIAYLNRPADPIKGKLVFDTQCVRCHGAEGKGEMDTTGREWKYPPIAGDGSYNKGAGLYRLSPFANFVKYNMPYGVTFDAPLLTDEEAWDVAAYVNSLPHPDKDLSKDWPDLSKKPVDHPFGPYTDSYTEEQHKYGPFTEMVKDN